jgi:predicted kinase
VGRVSRAVLVNGVPASGKSTIARALGERLAVPVVELDAVKEVLFEELGHGATDREWGRALGRASLGTVWAVLGGFPSGSTVIVDAWCRLPPHDHVGQALADARVERWVEVWCHAEPEILVSRYAARARHPGHPAAVDYVDELRELASIARPMGLAPCLEVDTADEGGFDLEAIARWVEAALAVDAAQERDITG